MIKEQEILDENIDEKEDSTEEIMDTIKYIGCLYITFIFYYYKSISL